jgi:VIT1/CCC1 family predicted Fe2+/Mn2+ transporter
VTGKRAGALVFGAADGLTLILGLVLGLAVSMQPGAAVWHAALSGGVAEFGGMALGQYWSDPDKNKTLAVLNGGASALTVIVAGLPFLLTSGAGAVVLALGIIAGFGAAVAWLREEPGWLAVARTFGLLLAAAALSAGANLIPF